MSDTDFEQVLRSLENINLARVAGRLVRVTGSARWKGARAN